jgi:hypothetical protein
VFLDFDCQAVREGRGRERERERESEGEKEREREKIYHNCSTLTSQHNASTFLKNLVYLHTRTLR